MKKSIKMLSAVVAVAMAVVGAMPVTVMAAQKKDVQITEKDYYPSWDTGKLELSYKTVTVEKYDEKGKLILKDEKTYSPEYSTEKMILRERTKTTYVIDEYEAKVEEFYYDENGKLYDKQSYENRFVKSTKGNKTYYTDGTYSITTEGTGGKKTIKNYSKNNKLESVTYVTKEGNKTKNVTKKNDIIIQEQVFAGKNIESSKSYNDKGVLLNECHYDSHGRSDSAKYYYNNGNLRRSYTEIREYKNDKVISEINEEELYNENGDLRNKSKYIRTSYSSEKMLGWTKLIENFEFEDGEWVKYYDTEYTYYTSGKNKGKRKSKTNRRYEDGEIIRTSNSEYTYKYDSNGRLAEEVEKDSDTGKIIRKSVFSYKAIK